MNYGKRETARKKKALRSKSQKWGKRFTLTVFKVVLLTILGVGIIGMCAGFGFLKGILESAPDISNIDVSPTGFSTFVYNCEGSQIAKLDAEGSNRVPVSMDKIPANLAHAFVAVEDARFYKHNGIDIQGIIRAGMMGLTSGHFSEGASTITQQLIKNNVLTSWTSENGKGFAIKLKRKIQEQYLAVKLEQEMEKDKILENYMNTINLGQNTLGVQAASKRYFGKSVSELNLSECAVIAAITQNPSRYNPITHPEDNAERRSKVLNNMLEQGFISQAEFDGAMADEVYDRIQVVNEVTGETTVNSYFVDALTEDVMDGLINAGYTETQAYSMLYTGGLSIYATQDPAIQSIADEVASNEDNYPDNTRWYLDYQLSIKRSDGEIENFSKEMMKVYFQKEITSQKPDSKFNLLFKSQDEAYAAIETYKSELLGEGDEVAAETVSLTPQPQISITIEDHSTGNVVAIVGGRGPKEGSRTLNRATNTKRQPGSTFKVVSTYAPALDSAGLTLADVFLDAPFNYENGRPVSNWYSSGYRGICSLRDGIRDSLNIIAVKTLTIVGPQKGFDYLQNFGFTTLVDSKTNSDGTVFSDINQSLSLGGITYGVKNIELNAAYATIANGGVYIKPKLYTRVVDHNGNVILDNTNAPTKRVIKESTAFLLTDAMVDVVTSGTGTSVNFGGMSIAGKTGTTSDYIDVWFAGYTPYYTCSTWTGYDENTHLTGAEKNLAKVIWRAVMSKVHEGVENKAFNIPSDIVTATVCSQSGKLPIDGLCNQTLKTEYFAKGTVPTETCDVHYQGMVCEYTQLPAAELCPFKVPGKQEVKPHLDLQLTGSQDKSVDVGGLCYHDETFFANAGADAVIQKETAELDARHSNEASQVQLQALQAQLQQTQLTLQAAQEQLTTATDPVQIQTLQSTVELASQEISSLQTQIAVLQAQIAAQAAAAAGGVAGNNAGPIPAE